MRVPFPMSQARIRQISKIIHMKKSLKILMGLLVLSGLQCTQKQSNSIAPDGIFEKAKPITMEELNNKRINGVSAFEVTDYSPAHYKEKIPNTPPHADMNPHRSFIIKWEKYNQLFVFNHEASYCPWLELPNGVALCNQFFEGNGGWAELFNMYGRKEKNSFVDIIKSGSDQVWIRWTYSCVNVKNDSTPALRGIEDYVTYPNGLIWRRLKYESLMPDTSIGYSWQPIDFFSVAPNGTTWKDLFPKDETHNDYLIASVLDVYSDKQYDKFWNDSGKVRRNGTDELLKEISQSKGMVMVSTTKDGYEFIVFGNSSGFTQNKNQIVDHSFSNTGGWGWNSDKWDHWPVGWLNSQTHVVDSASNYPYSFGPFSHYFINQRLDSRAPAQYWEYVKDMKLNKWTEEHIFYTLTGVAKDFKTIRFIAKKWLDKGDKCSTPESIIDLK
jgi:hypothetical protein